MEVTAKLRGAAISAQKVRLVADEIRGKSVERALDILTFSNTKGAKLVKSVSYLVLKDVLTVSANVLVTSPLR